MHRHVALALGCPTAASVPTTTTTTTTSIISASSFILVLLWFSLAEHLLLCWFVCALVASVVSDEQQTHRTRSPFADLFETHECCLLKLVGFVRIVVDEASVAARRVETQAAVNCNGFSCLALNRYPRDISASKSVCVCVCVERERKSSAVASLKFAAEQRLCGATIWPRCT